MQGNQSQGGMDDGGILLFFIIIALVYILFSYGFEYVAGAWKYLRITELYPMSLMPEFIQKFLFKNYTAAQGVDWLLNVPTEQITKSQVKQFDEHFGSIYKWPAGALIAFAGIRLIMKSTDSSTHFTLNSLLARQSGYFGHLKSFLTHHPENESIEYSLNNKDAIAVTPYEFGRMNPPPGIRKNTGPIYDGEFFDHDLARKVFDTQVGKPLAGIEQFSESERKIYDYLLVKLGTPEISCEDQAQSILAKHSFVRTGLMSLLEEARGGGAIACLEFAWLKQKDRTLWYCLQSVGRKVAFPEASGAFAHWLLEKHLNRSVPNPETTEAIEALYDALGLNEN